MEEEGIQGGRGARLELWPLWAVPLGLWCPLEFVSILDGYHHFLHARQFPFVYAASWVEHALPVIAVVALLWLVLRIVARSPGVVARAQWIVIAVARTIMGAVMADVALNWLHAVAPGHVPAIPIRTLALGAAVFAIALTVRVPHAGTLLRLSRRVAILSAILTMLLLPIEAIETALGNRKQPALAELRHGDKPDVVLITIDTFAANHTSLYGYGRKTTPRLDQFAQGATVFDRFYANSNFTSPTTASFMYGVRAWTHRAWNIGSPPVDAVYGRNLLRAFHDAGYRVMTVETNACAAPAQNRLLPWIDEAKTQQVKTAFLWHWWPGRWLPSFSAALETNPLRMTQRYIDKALLGVGYYKQNGHYAPQLALDSARELWTRDDARPRFLWVHLFGPHDPYAAAPEFLGAFDPSPEHRTRFDSNPRYQWKATRDPEFPSGLMGRYDEGILYFDHYIGTFLDWLKAAPGFEQSIVAISADHGESFSRGYGGHGGPLLSEELIHIPLIIKAPAQTQGNRSDVIAEQVDLPQTLLTLAGLPPMQEIEGRVIALDARADDDPAFSMNFERNRRFDSLTTGTIAMMQGRWKYVHYLNLKPYLLMPPMPDELYDVASDPREQSNLAETEPLRAEQMKGAILRELAKHSAPVS